MGALARLVDDRSSDREVREALNALWHRDSGASGRGTQIRWTDYDGDQIDRHGGGTSSSNNRTLVLRNGAGQHIGVLLSATDPDDTPDAANSVLLVDDAGLFVGAGRVLRLYDAAGTDYAQLVADSNGRLVIGGAGAGAGDLSVADVTAVSLTADAATLNGQVTLNTTNTGAALRPLLVAQEAGVAKWTLGHSATDQFVVANAAGTVAQLTVDPTTGNTVFGGGLFIQSGTANLISLTHSATALRSFILPDLSGTAALLGAANAGHLLFADNTYDIGASGATRPRVLYLGTGLNVAAGAQTLSATDVTLTAPWTSFSATVGLTQSTARTFTVTAAKYRVFGKTAHVMVSLVCTNAGVAGNAITITGLPAAIQPARTGVANPAAGVFLALEVGVSYKVGAPYFATTSSVQGIIHGSGGAAIGANPSFALANTGIVSCSMTYELA